jgi:hypothetical protein
LKIPAQFGFGLELRSDLTVPGAVSTSPIDLAPVVDINMMPPATADADAKFERDGDTIIYRHPAGSFRCAADRIEITPSQPTDVDMLGSLLVANALPTVLWQRGAFILHAACIRMPSGPTIAIAGRSGSGKSRLAASFVKAGAELLGDDSLALTTDGESIIAAGLPGGWYARQQGANVRQFKSISPGPAGGIASVDVVAVIGEAELSFVPLSPLSAFELLMQHRHRPQVPTLLRIHHLTLIQATRIAKHLAVFNIGTCNGSDTEILATRRLLTEVAMTTPFTNSSG